RPAIEVCPGVIFCRRYDRTPLLGRHRTTRGQSCGDICDALIAVNLGRSCSHSDGSVTEIVPLKHRMIENIQCIDTEVDLSSSVFPADKRHWKVLLDRQIKVLLERCSYAKRARS